MSLADIGRFIRTWGTTGAIAPSGRALARRMASDVDPTSPYPVLELGPGTGVVTRALIDKGVAPERIIAVEYNPEFCGILEKRFPGVQVVHGDAYDLATTLRGVHEGRFSGVVSSLPLLLRDPPARRALILDALSRTAPDGAYTQFSYSPRPPVPASPHDYRLSGTGFILFNLPPARVWFYRPPMEKARLG